MIYVNNYFGHFFYRGDEARKSNPHGMGVGLRVARAVIEAHHGKIEIDSDGPGKGARVTISLSASNQSPLP